MTPSNEAMDTSSSSHLALETSQRLDELENVLRQYAANPSTSQSSTPKNMYGTSIIVGALIFVFTMFLYFDDATDSKLVCIVFGIALGALMTLTVLTDLGMLLLPDRVAKFLGRPQVSTASVAVNKNISAPWNHHSWSHDSGEYSRLFNSSRQQATPIRSVRRVARPTSSDEKQVHNVPAAQKGPEREKSPHEPDVKSDNAVPPQQEAAKQEEELEEAKAAPTEKKLSTLMEACKAFDEDRSNNQSSSFDFYGYIDSFDGLRKEFPTDPDLYEVIYRNARAHYIGGNGDTVHDKEEKVRLMTRGYDLAKEALQMKKCVQTHKWVAITASGVGDVSSLKVQIAHGHVFYEHTLAALEFAPEDSELNHMFGRFAEQIAGLGWASKRLVAAIFGELPDVTYDTAVKYFAKARAIKPEWMTNSAYLAKCLKAQGNSDEAREIARLVQKMEPKSSEDKKALDIVSKLL